MRHAVYSQEGPPTPWSHRLLTFHYHISPCTLSETINSQGTHTNIANTGTKNAPAGGDPPRHTTSNARNRQATLNPFACVDTHSSAQSKHRQAPTVQTSQLHYPLLGTAFSLLAQELYELPSTIQSLQRSEVA